MKLRRALLKGVTEVLGLKKRWVSRQVSGEEIACVWLLRLESLLRRVHACAVSELRCVDGIWGWDLRHPPGRGCEEQSLEQLWIEAAGSCTAAQKSRLHPFLTTHPHHLSLLYYYT